MSKYKPGDSVWPLGAHPSMSGLGSLNSIFLAEEGATRAPSTVQEIMPDGRYAVELPSGYRLIAREDELTRDEPR